MTSDDLIVIKKSTIASKLGNLLGKMLEFYTKFNLEILLFWRRLLPESEGPIRLVDVFVGKESGFKWLVSFIRILLNNPITALFVSTFSMYLVGEFFQGRISQLLMWLCYFNLLTMMFQVMGWIDKLQGK
ncbi:MAG: hypothetical protein ACXACY_27840 [Candidatus Hodarchaeales archaeon]|jgi:hypothetical protein